MCRDDLLERLEASGEAVLLSALAIGVSRYLGALLLSLGASCLGRLAFPPDRLSALAHLALLGPNRLETLAVLSALPVQSGLLDAELLDFDVGALRDGLGRAARVLE